MKNVISSFEVCATNKNNGSKVGINYQHIHTDDVLHILKDSGYALIQANTGRTRTEHGTQLHFGLLQQTGNPPDKKDLLRMFIQNSHNGRSPLKLSFGMFRLACANQLPFALPGMTLSLQHRGNVISNLQERLPLFLKQAEVAQGLHAMFRDTIIDVEIAKREFTPVIEQARGCTALEDFDVSRRSEDYGEDLWTTLNRYQETAINGGTKVLYHNGDKPKLLCPIRGTLKQWEITGKLVNTAVKLAGIELSTIKLAG